MKLVSGVGINDRSCPAYVAGKATREYSLWKDMLCRCYSPTAHKRNPTYASCEVSESFKHFSYFSEWVGKQIGFNSIDDSGCNYQMDKDLLLKGNKVYSEAVCVFVPQSINLLLTKHNAARGAHPLGVSWHKQSGCYRAKCMVDGVQQHLGYYSTAKDAFYAYKEFKENLIKRVAREYQDQIDPRVFEALLNYAVEVDD